MDKVKSGTSTSAIKGQRNEREGHNINGCMKKQSQKESNDLVKKDIPREKRLSFENHARFEKHNDYGVHTQFSSWFKP